ncbi:conserved hypothetical protein [Verrucomicrobiia bacterium DG1235]|nr:conserved hypothetical protein [Verrucomicrobiae bacterium DG1235]
MKPFLFALIGLSAGAAITIQSSLSGQLSKRLANPLLASSSVFIVGFLAIAFLLLLKSHPLPSRESIAQIPLHLWIAGGLISAAALSTVYWIMPQAGVSNTLLYVITGQLLASALVSHFSWFDLPGSPINPQRAFALILVLSGALLFTSRQAT